MTFRYFAYGSNMWAPRMLGRCPSATLVGTALLAGWSTRYDKPGSDGTAKLNIRPDVAGLVHGVVYEIDEREASRLRAAEPAYRPVETPVGLTFTYEGPPTSAMPTDRYLTMVEAGAASHGLPMPSRPSVTP